MFNFLLWFNKENIRKKTVIQNFNFKESQETLIVETHIQEHQIFNSLGQFLLWTLFKTDGY